MTNHKADHKYSLNIYSGMQNKAEIQREMRQKDCATSIYHVELGRCFLDWKPVFETLTTSTSRGYAVSQSFKAAPKANYKLEPFFSLLFHHRFISSFLPMKYFIILTFQLSLSYFFIVSFPTFIFLSPLFLFHFPLY